ncbi:hypothetical protein MRI28_31545 [Nocardiopsis dassonvillei]|uniref:hypothetical protein n=1 Tax=Nocardiopsis dassonvillei TaxID=2014 RepID=UPI00200E557E|nr:hypothetical protein [Nocardiopsis dassonvillei]MCK9874103.1 hypothetical protein [Nocardiopsis dassonvillei]
MPAYTLTHTDTGHGPVVKTVGAEADFTRPAWPNAAAHPMGQTVVEAASALAALREFYTTHASVPSSEMVTPEISREAAAQVPQVLSDRAHLKRIAATAPRIPMDPAPTWFVDLDAHGKVLHEGGPTPPARHPDTARVVGLTPWFEQYDDGPLTMLWADAHVYVRDVLGPVPALIDVLADATTEVAPVFTADGARAYLRAARAWNEQMPAPCHLRLHTRTDRDATVELEIGPHLVDQAIELYAEDGQLLGPTPSGLYELPLPPLGDRWHITIR